MTMKKLLFLLALVANFSLQAQVQFDNIATFTAKNNGTAPNGKTSAGEGFIVENGTDFPDDATYDGCAGVGTCAAGMINTLDERGVNCQITKTLTGELSISYTSTDARKLGFGKLATVGYVQLNKLVVNDLLRLTDYNVRGSIKRGSYRTVTKGQMTSVLFPVSAITVFKPATDATVLYKTAQEFQDIFGRAANSGCMDGEYTTAPCEGRGPCAESGLSANPNIYTHIRKIGTGYEWTFVTEDLIPSGRMIFWFWEFRGGNRWSNETCRMLGLVRNNDLVTYATIAPLKRQVRNNGNGTCTLTIYNSEVKLKKPSVQRTRN